MTARSGYERLAQVDEDEEPLTNSRTSNLSKQVAILSQPTHIHRLPNSNIPIEGSAALPFKTRGRSNSGIDIKAINARLERCALGQLEQIDNVDG